MVMDHRVRLAIVTNKAISYRKDFFEAISCSEKMVVKVFIPEEDGESNHDNYSENIYEKIPGLAIRRINNTTTHLSIALFSALIRFSPSYIISGGASFPTLISLLYKALFRRKVFIWWAGTKLSEEKRNLVIKIIRRLLFSITDMFFAYSNYCKDYLETMGVSPERIIVIGNNTLNAEKYGRSSRETRDNKEGASSETFVILVVSQLIERKNIITILQSYLELSKKYPFIELRIAGEGPEENALKAFCLENRLKNVVFLGNIRHYEVVKEYSEADVLVHVAHMDQWPQVVNEAMSCGIPVIASTTSGIDDYFLQDGISGFLVDPADNEKLFLRLEYLLLNPDKAKSMGKEAYRVARIYDVRHVISCIENTILNENPSHP